MIFRFCYSRLTTLHTTMNSLASWLKSLSYDDRPPKKPECIVVTESLFMELEYQRNEAVVAEREKEQEERKKATGVDYSWLITHHPKPYEMPELDKLELEELCMKIQANECSKVISEFRKCLAAAQRKPNEIPRILRTVIVQTLELRPKEDSMSEWVMKGISRWRPVSARITPVHADEFGNTRAKSTVDLQKTLTSVNTSKSMPHLRLEEGSLSSSVEDLSQPVFKVVNRLEDLPV